MKFKNKMGISLGLTAAVCIGSLAIVDQYSSLTTTTTKKYNDASISLLDATPNISSVKIETNQEKYYPPEFATVTAVVTPKPTVTLEYEWYLGGQLIPKQDNKTSNSFSFPPRKEDNNKELMVKVLFNGKEIKRATKTLKVAQSEDEPLYEDKKDYTLIIVLSSVGGAILLGLILLFVARKMKQKEEGY